MYKGIALVKVNERTIPFTIPIDTKLRILLFKRLDRNPKTTLNDINKRIA